MLAILFSLKSVETLENGLQTHSGASSESCSSVNTDAWCKRALKETFLYFGVNVNKPWRCIRTERLYLSQTKIHYFSKVHSHGTKANAKARIQKNKRRRSKKMFVFCFRSASMGLSDRSNIYCPQTKLREGNVFTGVYLFTVGCVPGVSTPSPPPGHPTCHIRLAIGRFVSVFLFAFARVNVPLRR